MRQSLLRLVALLVLSVFLVAPAYAEGDKDKSPEDVFKALVAAVKKEDVKTSMSYLTRDSQSAIAGFMVFMAWGGRFDKREEARKAFEDVLKRHGLSDDVLKRHLKALKDRWDAIEEAGWYIRVGESVKDKPAFVDDVLELADKHEVWNIKKGSFKDIGEPKINDVKIEGEQARGQVTSQAPRPKQGTTLRLPPELVRGPSAKTETCYFKLESGVWKIDVLEPLKLQPPSASAAPAQVQPRVQPQAPPSYSRPGPLRRLLDRLRNW